MEVSQSRSAGLVVEGTGIPVGTIVQSVPTTETFTLNTRVTLSEDAALTFKLPSNMVVQDVTSQTSITLSSAQSISDNTKLKFDGSNTLFIGALDVSKTIASGDIFRCVDFYWN